jgi:two-component system sensor histidine kinase and response regulator WspE
MSNGDLSLLELFLSEVETHAATLEQNLLELENHPRDTGLFDSLMRAAHSIKGGARVVGLDHVVDLAHILEDCFEKAKEQKITLNVQRTDLLFKALDLLKTMAKQASKQDSPEAQEKLQESKALITEINEVFLKSSPAESSEPAEESAEPSQAPASEQSQDLSQDKESFEQQETSASSGPEKPESTSGLSSKQQQQELQDRAVRISAEKLEKLLGLGGEVMVSSGWLSSFSQELIALRKEQSRLLAQIDNFQDRLRLTAAEQDSKDLILQIKHRARRCQNQLIERLNDFEQFSGMSLNLSDKIYHEVLDIKMRPFSDGVSGFPRMVRDLAKKLGKKIDFQIIGKTTEVDRDILDKLEAPLTHLLRNAVDHGLETPEERLESGKDESGKLRLEASHRSGMLFISVRDDGRGISLEDLKAKVKSKGLAEPAMVERMTEPELMRFLFLPGFSTSESISEVSGRGVGLDVVEHMVQEVGGNLRASALPGQGLQVDLELPLTLSVIRMFMVEISGEAYAFPLSRIDNCLKLSRQDIHTLEDSEYFKLDDKNVALVNMQDILGLTAPYQSADHLPVVVLSDHAQNFGLVVDKFLGESDLTIRPLDARLGSIPDISSVGLTLQGKPVLVFDLEELRQSISKLMQRTSLRQEGLPQQADNRQELVSKILVVDDSITVREMERKLLENQGYRVELAVDGQAGLNQIQKEHFDLIVSDIDMPRMNGFELVKNIKSDPKLQELPVIIVSYKDSEEHRLQGLQAGADYYLTKSSFQDESFIQAVQELLGT